MNGKSCFFIGHRETSEAIYPTLYAAVEQHILEYGVTEFIVGHYGVFDRLAASAVKAAKHLYPDVKLILLLPYHPAERPIPTPDGFDNTITGWMSVLLQDRIVSKPLCCGSCRLPHRLCVAPSQQCVGAGGVWKKEKRSKSFAGNNIKKMNNSFP